jgi:hypothetical protein
MYVKLENTVVIKSSKSSEEPAGPSIDLNPIIISALGGNAPTKEHPDVRELASRYVDELKGQRDPKTGRKYTRAQRIAMAHERFELASHGLTLDAFANWKDRSRSAR